MTSQEDRPAPSGPATGESTTASTAPPATTTTTTAATATENVAAGPAAEQEEGQLLAAETDHGDDDDATDSAFGDAESSTASMSSSILEYRRVHGRTYHSDRFKSNYFLPNDDQQLDSVDLSHHYLSILHDDELYFPPLDKEKVQEVLDVGTGSGIWAIEFADRFPSATVTGTDISPCQPTWVPPNVRFEIDDATLDWTWDDNNFDFIHMRYLFGAIQDWTALAKQAFRCAAPGGWVQSGECDVSIRSDDGTTELEPILESYGELFREGGKVLNRPFFVEELQKKAFEEAGFVETKSLRFKLPVGGWAKDPKLAEVGRTVKSTLENDLQGYTEMMWRDILQRPSDEYWVWLASLRKAIRNPRVHGYMIVHYTYGRKPSA